MKTQKYKVFGKEEKPMNEIKIFAGNANLPLARDICEKLDVPMGNSVVTEFADGEVSVSIYETVRGKDVFIVQSTCKPVNDHLMELLVMIDAMKRASAGRITAVIPYFGYARQDRKAKSRDPISAKLVANLITAAGADRVLTMDLHANQIQGFFDIPVDHLHAEPVILKYIRSCRFKRPIVVSPDTGGAKTAYGYSRKLGTGLAIVAKQRTGDSEVDAFSVVGDVKGYDVIMIDDMTSTGGTLSAAAKILRANGAKSVHAFVSHFPLTPKGRERLAGESQLDELVVTDTIQIPDDFDVKKLPFKLTVLTVSGLIGEAIKRIHDNKSVNSLFKSPSNH
jgi:ribose-phosphate pyrophosphokinase